MTFEAATEEMFAAIEARDFHRLGRALAARGVAIKAGFRPTADTIRAGQRALVELAVLKRGLVLESARLRQLQNGMANAIILRRRPYVDYRA